MQQGDRRLVGIMQQGDRHLVVLAGAEGADADVEVVLPAMVLASGSLEAVRLIGGGVPLEPVAVAVPAAAAVVFDLSSLHRATGKKRGARSGHGRQRSCESGAAMRNTRAWR